MLYPFYCIYVILDAICRRIFIFFPLSYGLSYLDCSLVVLQKFGASRCSGCGPYDVLIGVFWFPWYSRISWYQVHWVYLSCRAARMKSFNQGSRMKRR
ncbi:hypothetical protein BKA69DRAFT_1105984 [Paraphysoderma sedebokerense]|nr:hypothetical protein BKA69DRAFT_1105984 [Paraphysoderma sedebokerense]